VLESAVFILIAATFEPEALELADRAVELFPNSVESHNARGRAAQAVGDFAEARAAMEHALELEPLSMMPYNLGTVLIQMGESRAALDQFDRALELDANNVSASENRALALRLLGRHDEAARAFGC